jgi:hypothetical protein
MRKKLYLIFEIDFTEWALPLEVWWTRDQLCFEVFCFAFTLSKTEIQVIIDDCS